MLYIDEILPGQDNLIGSLWSNTAALASNPDLAGVRSTIQSTAGRGFKVGLEEFSALSPQAERNLSASDSSPLLSSTSGAALEVSWFNQPYYHRYSIPSASDHEVKAAQDPLTGMAEGTPLVSAQTINTKINFQPDDAFVPKGYIEDAGKPYNPTRSFGWVEQGTHKSLDVTANARDRDRPGANQRLDTLIHMQGNDISGFTGVKIPAAWEYKLPDGTYKVTISVGDQPKYDSRHTINVEGVTAINRFHGSVTQEYKQATVQTKVSDGKLTIDAIGGINTKINYIHIASGFTKVNWSTVAPSPIGRSEALGATVDGKLYVFGGYINTTYTPTRRSDVYDPASNTWTRIKDLPKGLTHTGTAVDEVNNDIYLAGGYIEQADGSGQTYGTKNVWKYDVETDTWTTMPLLPQARASGELSLVNGELHFFGGTNIKRTQDVGNHWVLSLNGGTSWTRAAPLPNPRTHMGDAVIGGKIYAIGGQHGHDQNLVTQNSVHEYNPVTNKWRAVASMPKALSHISASTFVMDGRIIVAGGETDHGGANTVADVTAYDPVSNSWTALTPLPAPRRSGVAGSLGNQIFYTTGSPSFKTTTYKGVPAN